MWDKGALGNLFGSFTEPAAIVPGSPMLTETFCQIVPVQFVTVHEAGALFIQAESYFCMN